MKKAFLSVVLCLSLCFSLPASAKQTEGTLSLCLSYEALLDTLCYDVSTYQTDGHTDWITLLALLATRYDGDLRCYRERDLSSFLKQLRQGISPRQVSGNSSQFSHYRSSLELLLGNTVGRYTEVSAGEDGVLSKRSCYGLRLCSPIADLHSYVHSEDFGLCRAGTGNTTHRGHDLFGSVGTPVLAVEGGIVEEIGWDNTLGHCVTIRSRTGTRIYRYGHLQNDGALKALYKGKVIFAGEVIGSLGMTGNSTQENVNNVPVPHLHYEVRLSGKPDSFIDLFALTELLSLQRNPVSVSESGELISCRYLITP